MIRTALLWAQAAAVIPAGVAADVGVLIRVETQHALPPPITVGPLNLEAVVEQITAWSTRTCLTFVFLIVSGELSSGAVFRLLSLPHRASVRLVIPETPHILQCLDATNAHKVVVRGEEFGANDGAVESAVWRVANYPPGPLPQCIRACETVAAGEDSGVLEVSTVSKQQWHKDRATLHTWPYLCWQYLTSDPATDKVLWIRTNETKLASWCVPSAELGC